jgi:hypothetical protein
MIDDDQNQLLGDILGDDELNELRHEILLRGLKEMRRRRQCAMMGRVSMMALPALLLAVAAFYPRVQPALPTPAPPVMTLASTAASKVEYINKEQLFALFPNRPMALVGKPGHQQVIFLDGPATTRQQ